MIRLERRHYKIVFTVLKVVANAQPMSCTGCVEIITIFLYLFFKLILDYFYVLEGALHMVCTHI